MRARTQVDPNAPKPAEPEDPTMDAGPRLDADEHAHAVGDFGGFRQLDREVNELLSDVDD